MAGIRALLGLFPKTGDYESVRNQLEEEYNSLLAFKNSKQLRDFLALESQVKSEEFAQKKKEILSLRFKNTDDYSREAEYNRLRKSKDIKLYYKIKDSEQLRRFEKIKKSKELKEFLKLEEFVNSPEFAEVKKEASVSAKQKFERSDLAETLGQYNAQKNLEQIKAYFKFISDKKYNNYINALNEGLPDKIAFMQDKTQSESFIETLKAYKKAERKQSKEYQLLEELKKLKKSKQYKDYNKMSTSPLLESYKVLHNSDELEAFVELEKFIRSDEFKQQRKEIESFSFKDTEAYDKLLRYKELKKSADIIFYFKFLKSKQLDNYNRLNQSERISGYEELHTTITSDEFIKFKAYCLKKPKQRWEESEEYEVLQDYELKKKSEKIVWYYKNIDHKKLSWHRNWTKTFSEEFTASKVDAKKWLTRYYWGDKMLNDSYSIGSDKHFVTNGKNLKIENDRLHIITKKENVKGKSWHARHGFLTKTFNYTSGLINTAKSFRQRYGIFEAKIRVDDERNIINAFWMVGKKIVPHIDVVKANGKLCVGNYWGSIVPGKRPENFTSKRSRSKFTTDFFIYSLEWKPGKLIWKINGVEVAATTKGIPDEELYLVFSAGLQKDVTGTLPTQMEIDWVRCYQSNDLLIKGKKN